MQRSSNIQGLRAIAVGAVVLFHAGFLPGGYVGVDIFYVISGFLITTLILKDEKFSFVNFYNRRAKRLLPASFLVLIVTALGFWFLAPKMMRPQFAKDLLASTWYVSNYLYAHWQNDYQNLGANPSALIHYWSLAVEEQFYLFWPLILVATRKHIRFSIPLIGISSFLLSLYLVKVSPIFAFYSLPTRAFELAIGALLAIFSYRSLSLFTSWLGLIAISISFFIFDSHTAFPALPALLPTLGSLLIVASQRNNFLLTNDVFQKVGDWSYSIYLWHWPLLVIPGLYLQRPLTIMEKLEAISACILLSILTYKFVETPLRKIDWKPARTAKIALGTGALISLSTTLFANASAPFDLSAIREQPIIYKDGCHLDKQATKPNMNCIYGEKTATRNVVLFGDSHAAQWFPALDLWAKKRGYKLYVMTKSSCPAIDFNLKDLGAFKADICNQFRQNALKEIATLRTSLLIIGNFEHYEGLRINTDNLNVLRNYPVLILRDTPWPNRDIPVCITTKANCDTAKPKFFDYGTLPTFDPIPLLCNKKCPAKVDGLVAYRDQTHITVAMAIKLSDALGRKLDTLVAR